MRIINRGRACGKTSILISTAYALGIPIIVNTEQQRKFISEKASKLNMNGIDVYTVEEWLRTPHHGEKALYDNVEYILSKALSNYFNTDIVAATMSIPMEEIDE